MRRRLFSRVAGTLALMERRAAVMLLTMLLTAMTAWAEDVTVNSGTTTWTSGNTYNVTSNVTIDEHVSVTGSVTLNISSGVTLNVNNGITMSDDDMLTVTGQGSLNIYGENGKDWAYIDENEEEKEPATDGGNAVYGNLTINGGTVNITGGNGGIGFDIWGYDGNPTNGGYGVLGHLIVNGGSVTVIGGNAHYRGIAGSAMWYLTVNDGNVTVKGGNRDIGDGGSGTAAYGVDRDITINGGTVQIYGEQSATGRTISYADDIIAEERYEYYEEEYHLLTGNSSNAEHLRFHPGLVQDGDTYSINELAGWNGFCKALRENDFGYFTGKTIKLCADIAITQQAGISGHDFSGTFDGQGHTLTVNLSGAQYVAPFFYVKSQDNDHPATIQNLRVSGTVTGSDKFAAGIAGGCANVVNITNCLVDVTINSSVNGDGTHGGLVGVFDGGTLNITGCAFTGKLLSTGSSATTKCGGIVGYSHVSGTAVNITNSLYAPAALVGSETEPTGDSMTFLRSTNTTVTITNSYYTRTLGDAQGTQARSIEAGASVTISNLALTGTPTEYNVSGITAYSGGGLALDNGATLYYGSGDQVSLTLSNSATGAPLGYQYGYSASAGTISGYMLTMADANATVNVDTDVLLSTGQPVSVSYIDAAGTTDSHDAIALDETMTSLAADQWYFVGKDIDYTQTVTLGGNTTLILADGCTLNIGTSSKRISSGYCIDGSIGYKDLTIYGQSGQSGSLNAYNSASDSNPVKVNNYTQHGGNVTIDGTKKTALETICDLTLTRGTLTAITDDGTWGNTAICSGTGRNVSVSGGTVNASGRYAISGALNITAGTVNATGSIGAIYSSTTVSGGNLNATGGRYSIYDNISFTGGSANVTLTGDIYKNLTIAAGLVFTDGTNYYAGTLTADEKTAISGKTLTRLTALPLADAADNTAAIDKCNGATDIDITLQGRTLFKDGKWNTLCLPFALSAEQIAAHADFAGATLMELDKDGKNGFDPTDGTLYLTFKAATAIAAGVPYLVKWDAAGTDFTSPTFSGVTINAAASTTVSDADGLLEEVQMVGCYSPVSVTANDKSILYLGEGNTLYYSSINRDIRSCRAYFSVPYIKQNAGAKARAFHLDFGDGEQTGISSLTPNPSPNGEGSSYWYSLDGRRLAGKPTKSGVYVNGGRKVVIK